jgi:hypothetical protein
MDSGATWKPTGNAALNSLQWQVVATSSDGINAYAAVNGGDIYSSTNSGVTWTPTNNINLNSRAWLSLSCSSDGNKFAAGAYGGGDFYRGTLISAPLPISNICFPAGTLITTDQGRIPIDHIRIGLHTINGIKIILVTKIVTIDDHLVCFEKDSLGPNCPSERTLISKNHMIFHGDSFEPAEHYIDGRGVHPVIYNGEALYNILLEREHLMYVNNLICETLSHDNHIVQMYRQLETLDGTERETMIKNYNRDIMHFLHV